MIKHYLHEDNRPPKLPVIFSKRIIQYMDYIEEYNQNNTVALEQWYDEINTLVSYISNPVIAWDYINKYVHFKNGATHLVELGFDVMFIIKTNEITNNNYIYVFKINLNPQKLGLKIPPNMNENKTNYINKTMNRNKKIVRLTESDLHNIITEAVKVALNELDPRTYASAASKADDRFDPRGRKFHMAAVDAWNRDYGEDVNPWHNNGMGRQTMMHYADGPMGEYDVYTNNNDNEGRHLHYKPYGNRLSGRESWDGEEIDRRATSKDLKNNKGWKTAREMHLGNGKYIKGKGWQ